VKLRLLIVDDEPLARKRLRRLLETDRQVEVVRECDNGAAAIEAIAETAPDVVLLDVRMPGADGFEVLKGCGVAPPPEVVFVTAHDQHAIRAFEHHALDYLLKPVSAERLADALAHARRRLRATRSARRRQRSTGIVAGGEGARPVERLLVREQGRAWFLRTAQIESLESDGNYVLAHTPDRKSRVRLTLSALAATLDPHTFRRINRTAIVNVDHVREIQPWFHGDAIVVLRSGRQLRLSRTRRTALLD
jgi:two-component system LytT family response regulator